jgi:hypothetical protein
MPFLFAKEFQLRNMYPFRFGKSYNTEFERSYQIERMLNNESYKNQGERY